MNIQTEFEQAAQLIKNAKNIILMPHAKMDCDGMSAAVSLYLFLSKLGKNATAVCPDPVPEAFDFLPSSHVFEREMPNGNTENQGCLVTVNTDSKKFKDLQYTIEDGKVNIMLFSEDSPFEENDFSFVGANIAPDLIITLDSGDTAQLGKVYTDNRDLFDSVPVINIDHHISNTEFGDVNLVDFKSCSTTELVYKLIPFVTTREDVIDENIATLLLAGMLTDTGSFQHSNTTPASLDIAAQLIEKGARHQEIVQHLFKTKSLSTLRVWGRILTKLQNDPIYRMVWSSVSSLDIDETQSHSDDAEGLIDELMATTPGTELVLLVKEREDSTISTSIRSRSPSIDSMEFARSFGGGGHKQAAGFKIRERGGKSFEEIVSDIIFEAKKFQANRLGVPMPKRDILSSLAEQNKELSSQVVPQSIPEPMTDSMPAYPQDFTPEVHSENLAHEDVEVHVQNGNEEHIQTEKAEEISAVPQESRETMEEHIPPHAFQQEAPVPQGNFAQWPQGEGYLPQQNTYPAGDTSQQYQQYSYPNQIISEPVAHEAPVGDQSVPAPDPFLQQYSPETVYQAPQEVVSYTAEDDTRLSPAEEPYLNTQAYQMPAPEKEIEKHEEDESYIDSFADFLSKTEDDYFPEQSAPAKRKEKNVQQVVVSPVENNAGNDAQDAESLLENFTSAMNEEDNILASLQTPGTTEVQKVSADPLLDTVEHTAVPSGVMDPVQQGEVQAEDPFLAALAKSDTGR